MPYVKKENRHHLDKNLGLHVHMDGPGDLNYMITRIIDRYLEEHGLKYQHINDILGALEGAKLEFYRRVAVPYENSKMVTNGDVYKPRSPRV